MAQQGSSSPQRAPRTGSDRSRARRIRLACRRCQRRKIKCDEGIPKCSACQRAGVECHNGKRLGEEGNISRLQEAPLRHYIRRLENALREKAPDLPLESLQSVDGQHEAIDQSASPRGQGALSPSIAPADPNIEGFNAYEDDQLLPSRQQTSHVQFQLDEETQSDAGPAHEIGLVPLSSGISKYVGPSSGLVFARSILDRAGRNSRNGGFLRSGQSATLESPSTTISRSLLPITPADLPATLSQASQLSRIYFEYVHIQHPFLYRPSFLHTMKEVYEHQLSTPKWMLFQVRMVLAISAVILARRLPIPYSGERLYASAIQDKDNIDFHSSLDGLQCLLLVYMYTLHSPSSGVSSWHLNYEFLAIVLDLGLQRDVAANADISSMEKELRTRIFWVVYSIDRTIATTLGRPIGLRDEACDLRLPSIADDADLTPQSPESEATINCLPTTQEGSMACALTLFKLANLNSELKYILHSIVHTTPRYTYPQITNIDEWQQDLWTRLQDCFTAAPKFADERRYLSIICEIKYLEIAMHLFRPTPRIRSPTVPNLRRCYEHAERTIVLWTELYKMDRLSYSWVMIHSVCLSALTILYCVWTCHEISRSVRIHAFTSSMREASVLLSIAGEYWTEARRSRHQLDELVNATTRWLIDKLTSRSMTREGTLQSAGSSLSDMGGRSTSNYNPNEDAAIDIEGQPAPDLANTVPTGGVFDNYINNDDLFTFLGAPDPFMGNGEMPFDGLFVDYQPLFDFSGNELHHETLG